MSLMDQYSPKSSSPHGARSPRGEPSGLKMTISLKNRAPFYLFRSDPIPSNETTGATNLMQARGLEHSYNKLSSEYNILIIFRLYF